MHFVSLISHASRISLIAHTAFKLKTLKTNTSDFQILSILAETHNGMYYTKKLNSWPTSSATNVMIYS